MNDSEKIALLKRIIEDKIKILEKRNSMSGYHRGRLDLAHEILTIVTKEE